MSDLATWDPFSELSAMRTEMDELLAREGEDLSAVEAPWSPVSDVIEREDAFVITAELPGVHDEDIDISVTEGFLTIRGTRWIEDPESSGRLNLTERPYGGFERVRGDLQLPQGVEVGAIHAGIAYGALKVTVPKSAVSEPRRIPVEERASRVPERRRTAVAGHAG